MPKSALTDAKRWFQPITSGNHRASLLCFPYAGSGAALFGSWRPRMFEGVELIAAKLPGREGRLETPPHDNLDRLVELLAESVEHSRYGRSPLFLLGCSVGALIAFELARSLQHRGVSVDYLIVAASRAPQSVRTRERLHQLPDEKFIRKIQKRYAAIPPQVLANEESKRLLLPMLRADVKMLETYSYSVGPKLECPILAMGGTDDQMVTVGDLFGWRNQTHSFRQRMFPGDHYFIRQSNASVLQTIERRLKPLIGR